MKAIRGKKTAKKCAKWIADIFKHDLVSSSFFHRQTSRSSGFGTLPLEPQQLYCLRQRTVPKNTLPFPITSRTMSSHMSLARPQRTLPCTSWRTLMNLTFAGCSLFRTRVMEATDAKIQITTGLQYVCVASRKIRIFRHTFTTRIASKLSRTMRVLKRKIPTEFPEQELTFNRYLLAAHSMLFR